MSLQIWLPLNGDLTQQGLSNATVTNNGVTVDSNGKIGKCYSFADNKYISTNYTWTSGNTFSMFTWMKKDAKTDGGTLFRTTTKYSPIIDFNGTSGEVRVFYWYNSSNYCMMTYPALEANIWYHVGITYDGTTFCFYINGEVVKSITTSFAPYITGTFNIGKADGANFFKGKMNDVRIYDHCLSKKEVKELAKGLVLHYRLAGPGQENLIKASGPNEDGWGINQSGGTFTKTVTAEGTSFEVTTQATSWFLYYHKFTNLSTAGLKPNTEYTYSFECKSNQSFNLDIKILKGNGTIPLTNNKAIRIEGDNEWHRYKVTLTTNSTLDISDQYFYMNGGNVIAKTQFRYAKLEEGTIATPWTPHPSDALWTAMGYSNNIEYDCSGFGYNSTIKYPPVWDVNSPRYTTSYKFDGTAYLIVPNPFPVGAVVKEFTHTAWIKWDSACNTNSGIHSIAFGNEFFRFALGKGSQIWTYGIRCEADGSGTSQTAILTHGALGNLVHNKWYFIAIAFKDGACKAYIDGELVASNTSAKVGLKSNTTEGAIGAYTSGGNERAIGNISDSRFYATELSAADIQELYHSAVIIDNTGKTYAYEYFE